MPEIRYLEHEETESVDCPHPGCGARAGTPCLPTQQPGRRPSRNHALRVNAAAESLGVVLPHHQRGYRRRQVK